MLLNIDILSDFLRESFALSIYGEGKKERSLGRPLLYVPGDELLSDSIYLCSPDNLPPRNAVHHQAVVVLVGGIPPASFLSGRFVCISIHGQGGIAEVLNELQSIFDRFDRWEQQLAEVLNSTAYVSDLLEASFPIIGNPMVAIDSEYRHLGCSSIIETDDRLARYRSDEQGMMRPELLAQSIDDSSFNMAKSDAFLVESDGDYHYSVNLFKYGSYAGNLSVSFVLRPYRASDGELCKYLAEAIEQALVRLTPIRTASADSMRDVFRSLLTGEAVGIVGRQRIMSLDKDAAFRCARLVRGERSRKKIPIAYYCTLIENTFPGGAAFEYEDAISAFIPIDPAETEAPASMEKLWELAGMMDLEAGVSGVLRLQDFEKTRFFYRQAEVALQVGSSVHPGAGVYRFDDYILRCMLYSCLGSFPVDFLYSDGLKKLVAYDRNMQADYLETLRVYLDNNLNVSRAAQELRIHRSTLTERLQRIQDISGIDANDSEQRLYAEIVLALLALDTKHVLPL